MIIGLTKIPYVIINCFIICYYKIYLVTFPIIILLSTNTKVKNIIKI